MVGYTQVNYRNDFCSDVVKGNEKKEREKRENYNTVENKKGKKAKL